MIYNSRYETMDRVELRQVQLERLQMTLNRVYRNVAFYKKSCDEYCINVEDIKHVDDINKLPFTTKEDLRQSYPYDMFAVPLRDIIRIHSSRGRTGRPVGIGFTKNDIHHWTELTARVLAGAGVTDHDFIQIAIDYAMVTGGFGVHYGAEAIGASVIPSSSQSNIQNQIHIMKDYKTSVLVSTPSYAVRLAGNLDEMGIHPEELNLRIGVFGAEPWNERTREMIEERLHISAYNIYGINEIIGPGISGECEHKNGLHVNEDHFIVEIIHPETLEPVSPGEKGELVVSTITKEGFPLIRYRTNDVSYIIDEPCPCGRTTIRMSNVTERTDDMIVVGGVSFFPGQVEEILANLEGMEPRFQILIDNEEGLDTAEIRIEVSEKIFNDEMKRLMEIKNAITGLCAERIGLKARVSLVEPGTILKDEGKTVIDKRKKK